MIIKENMTVLCRTKEEQEVYVEIATKEGWRRINGNILNTLRSVPMNYTTNYGDSHRYPNGVSQGMVTQSFPSHLTIIEASDLFRNQLISRRAKHDKRAT